MARLPSSFQDSDADLQCLVKTAAVTYLDGAARLARTRARRTNAEDFRSNISCGRFREESSVRSHKATDPYPAKIDSSIQAIG